MSFISTVLAATARSEGRLQHVIKSFADGELLMLHHACMVGTEQPHPDAGRIGCIVSCERHADGQPKVGGRLVVQFWRDDLVGSSTFSLIPVGHWLPIGAWMAEEYEPRAGRYGWRLSPAGRRIFEAAGWESTAATRGEA